MSIVPSVTDDLIAELEYMGGEYNSVSDDGDLLITAAARIRQLESVLREAGAYLDISAIHTGSVLHETMRAALGDQP